MRKIIVFITVILLLALSGCEGYSKKELEEIATQAALGTLPPKSLQTAAAIYFDLTMTPTPTITPTITPYPGTATMGPQEWIATQYAEERIVGMTQEANKLAFEREKIRATEIAIGSRETQKAIEEERKIVHANQTAAVKSTQAYATSFAASTATQAQGLIIAANNTAAAQATASVEPTHAAWTQTAVSIQVRIDEGQARGVEMSTERQRIKNIADAVLPWSLVLCAFAVLASAVAKYVKVRPFKRDEHGREQTLFIQNGPVTQVVRPELMSSPVIRLTDEGSVDMPLLNDAGEQSDVTRRAQLADVVALMPDSHASQAPKMIAGEYGGNGVSDVPKIRLRGDQALDGVINEIDERLVEE